MLRITTIRSSSILRVELVVQVFTSVSTTVFKTFACDEDIVVGESFLRADYSISCNTSLHTFFEIYAGLMILVRRLAFHIESPWGYLVSAASLVLGSQQSICRSVQ